MRKVLSSRFLLVTLILAVAALLLGQNMGIAGHQAPSEASAADSTIATTPAAQVDWALIGLLVGGAMITLLRPRRRKTVPVTR